MRRSSNAAALLELLAATAQAVMTALLAKFAKLVGGAQPPMQRFSPGTTGHRGTPNPAPKPGA